ncbi:acylphosphatase [Lactobacillus gasseri]|uniref:acylphosphatase n=1 Tax=Lactobacillus gasseri TaxID=1596 RepID=A0A833CFN4_LACGS|nr:acylphosphatase [Lactobacillus gasseri]KAB1951072.1 acylphosphatase [Lactobacillus gasseri]
MKTVTMKVTGLVQGIGFRWTTQMIAQDLGITGTVKNNPDGSVSIVAQGEELPLEHFIKKIKASPSVAGHVNHVDLNTVSDAEKFTRFSVVY